MHGTVSLKKKQITCWFAIRLKTDVTDIPYVRLGQTFKNIHTHTHTHKQKQRNKEQTVQVPKYWNQKSKHVNSRRPGAKAHKGTIQSPTSFPYISCLK